MRNLLLLLVMTFPIGENFNLQGFLDTCREKGMLLYAPAPGDSPHGHVLVDGEKLIVTLYETAKSPTAVKVGRRKMQMAGNAVLSGGSVRWKPVIKAAIDANSQ